MNRFTIFLLLGVIFISSCNIFGENNHQNGNSLNNNIQTGSEAVKVIIKKDWIFPFLILGGIGGGLLAIFLGYKSGIKLMAASFILISIYLAFIQFHKQIAIAGFISCIILLIYTIINVKKTIKENIIGIQKFKESNPTTKSAINDFISSEQSQTTKDIVNKVKYDLKLLELKNEYKEKKQDFFTLIKKVINRI